jgi:hypothetical protein
MKRPPNRKLVLAALVLLVAAGAAASRPAVGLGADAELLMLMFDRSPGEGARLP